MSDQRTAGRSTRAITSAVAVFLGAAAVVAYARLAGALIRLWGDLFDGGSVGAHRLLVGMFAIPIVLALVALAVAWRRCWSWVGAVVASALLLIVGSVAAILIAAGANLTST